MIIPGGGKLRPSAGYTSGYDVIRHLLHRRNSEKQGTDHVFHQAGELGKPSGELEKRGLSPFFGLSFSEVSPWLCSGNKNAPFPGHFFKA